MLRNLGMGNPLKDSFKGIAVGAEEFIEGIMKRIDSVGQKREIPITRAPIRYTADEIIRQVMDEMSISQEEIFSKRRGNFHRRLTLYLLKKYTPLTLKEIGELFQMDYSAVSQACKRHEERIRREGCG